MADTKVSPEIAKQVAAMVLEIERQKKEVISGSVNIVRAGDQITLPEGMSYDEGILWLNRQKTAEEARIDFEHVIDAFPLEGAHALAETIKEVYGFATLKQPENWFESNPTLISIDASATEKTEVPWGKFKVPSVDATIGPMVISKDNRLQFAIVGETKVGDKAKVAELARKVQERVRTKSIYRGKAIQIRFPASAKEFDVRDCPKFMDVSKADPNGLIFGKTLQHIVQTSIFTPIERTAECRKHGIPLKRGVLLEGPFGCGKSLTAHVTARKCEENGWTFIYLKHAGQLAQAIEFSRQYQPCVIFAEDIDRVVQGERTASLDEILNTIDGIVGKNSETMIVLTTNDVEKINKAMLRPGRLDAVISVQPPDADAAIRLVRLYASGLLDWEEDFGRVGQLLAGKIPAVIREVVERSKLAAIGRLEPNADLRLTAHDLEVAAETLIRHLALLAEPKDDDRSDIEKAADALGGHLRTALSSKVATNSKHDDVPNGHKAVEPFRSEVG